jgi:hypothetical protein
MKYRILTSFGVSAIALTGFLTVPVMAETLCRVTDPTTTPLNVRTSPDGRIVGSLRNGDLVSVLDPASNKRGRSWVFVGRFEDRMPLGWVFREYLDCDEPHVKVLEQFTCSGTVGSSSTGIADRSIGGGDSMCYFVSQSDVGRKILGTCSVGSNCRIVGTVKNDQNGGDWSPIITDTTVIVPAEMQTTPKSEAQKTSYECAIVSVAPKDRESDPVYKIEVEPQYSEGGGLNSLTIVHNTISGNKYSRSDQYQHSRLVDRGEGGYGTRDGARELVGISCGAVSGQLMVSDQATRSIG